jgi:hypothetical protein
MRHGVVGRMSEKWISMRFCSVVLAYHTIVRNIRNYPGTEVLDQSAYVLTGCGTPWHTITSSGR